MEKLNPPLKPISPLHAGVSNFALAWSAASLWAVSWLGALVFMGSLDSAWIWQLGYCSCWCGNQSNSWETSIVLDSKDWSLYAHVIPVGSNSPPLNWPATFFCRPVVPWATIQHVRIICDLQRFRHQWQWRLASKCQLKVKQSSGVCIFPGMGSLSHVDFSFISICGQLQLS